MAEFTPGPWIVESHVNRDMRDGSVYFTIEAEIAAVKRGGVIADTLNCDFVFNPDEQRANAYLIAAAPLLLVYAVCEEAWCDDHYLSSECMNVLRVAGYTGAPDDGQIHDWLCDLRARALKGAIP